MDMLPLALKGLEPYKQFIVYFSCPREGKPGKFDKMPANYRNGYYPINPLDKQFWTDAQTAIEESKRLGKGYGVGFVFTPEDPFWFLDIDDCVVEVKGEREWSPLAKELMEVFSGAAMQPSLSGSGLHIIARGKAPAHAKRNNVINCEFYTEARFSAFGEYEFCGDVNTLFTDKLDWLVNTHFQCNDSSPQDKVEWTESAYEGWPGLKSDEELIDHALRSKSPAAVFGAKAPFFSLWNAEEDVLAKYYPPSDKSCDSFNRSSADMALACHLLYFTGGNCERTKLLMQESKLVREKWEREDYLLRTISKAYSGYLKWRISRDINSELSQVCEDRPLDLPDLPPVMPFNYSFIPPILHEYVKDISERMQCPPDFIAVPTIVMLAGMIGRKVAIRPKRNDNWTIIVNIWGAIIGHSGIKKTPALNSALKPIMKLQAKEFEKYEKEKEKYDEFIKQCGMKNKAKKTQAQKFLEKDLSADISSYSEDKLPPEPVARRLITNNSTYEKLGEIVMKNLNGVVVIYDEIIGLFKQLDAPGQEVARSFYLSGANGDTASIFDRINRGTLHIEAVCLSIIGGIQPGVLAHYVKQAMDNGAGADGLLQRFGLMVYPDIPPVCEYIDRSPNIKAYNDLVELIARIDNLNPIACGATIDPHGGVPYLNFNDDAQKLYVEWTVKLDMSLRSGEEHPAVISHLAKYQKLVPSLALIFNFCENNTGAVTERALQMAINYSAYLESHARRIYSPAIRSDIDAAKLLLKRLATGKLIAPFKSRDVSQKRWVGLDTAEKADAAINTLWEHRHLRKEELETKGRPTVLYHWIKKEGG